MTTIMNEYYSNKEAVASAVYEFMKMSVNELKSNPYMSRNFGIMTNEIIQTEGLDIEQIDKMSYLDLIDLLEMSRDIKYGQFYNNSEEICTSELFNLYNYKILLYIIIGAAKKSAIIRLFLELPVKTFYEYADSISVEVYERRSFDYYYFMYEVERLNGEVSEELTIKELLGKVNEKVSRGWDIVDRTIEDYGKMIIDELKLVRTLLGLKFLEMKE